MWILIGDFERISTFVLQKKFKTDAIIRPSAVFDVE